MKTRTISATLLAFAISCGVGIATHAQEGPPPPPYGDQDHHDRDHDRHDEGPPGLRAGFHDGFDNGRDDAQNHHTFVPERAYQHNGRRKFHEQFGHQDQFARAYHDGYIRGYERGYRGGDREGWR